MAHPRAPISVDPGALRMDVVFLRVRSRPAFSLIELLVVLTIASLLLGLLMPTFRGFRESARQAVCASNLHQLGIAMTLYLDGHGDRFPHSIFSSRFDEDGQPQEMIATHLGNGMPKAWDGLGFLFANQVISSPEVFYCPSHVGTHPFERYAESWNAPGPDRININYHYRDRIGREPLSKAPPSLLRQRFPSEPIVSDGLRTKSDFSHVTGTNILRVDMTVKWFEDEKRIIYGSLPDVLDEDRTWQGRDMWRTFSQRQ